MRWCSRLIYFQPFCELSGVSAPQGLQGQSFAGALLGRVGDRRSYAITGRNLDDHWGNGPGYGNGWRVDAGLLAE